MMLTPDYGENDFGSAFQRQFKRGIGLPGEPEAKKVPVSNPVKSEVPFNGGAMDFGKGQGMGGFAPNAGNFDSFQPFTPPQEENWGAIRNDPAAWGYGAGIPGASGMTPMPKPPRAPFGPGWTPEITPDGGPGSPPRERDPGPTDDFGPEGHPPPLGLPPFRRGNHPFPQQPTPAPVQPFQYGAGGQMGGQNYNQNGVLLPPEAQPPRNAGIVPPMDARKVGPAVNNDRFMGQPAAGTGATMPTEGWQWGNMQNLRRRRMF